ncbi:MAG: hypothetical protein OXN27_18975 [Candidatus Poribacteria bacterium]|nr:hypothetical protein [Candidatus Poribacteria bacterium]
MNRQMYWGLGVLIIVLTAAGGFMYWQWSTVQQLKEQLAQDEKLLEEMDKPVAENNLPPAPSGYKWVPHGNHHHLVPIDAPDVWQEGTPEPIAKEVQAKPTYTGPLTYHAELLETHPVKALRLQAEERGHWSAKWIPSFPPDDQEAAAIARDLYLITYYDSIGDTTNPICQKAFRNNAARRKADRKKEEKWSERRAALTYKDAVPPSEEYKQVKWEGARMNDLARLRWARVTEGLILDPARFASKTLLPE